MRADAGSGTRLKTHLRMKIWNRTQEAVWHNEPDMRCEPAPTMKDKFLPGARPGPGVLVMIHGAKKHTLRCVLPRSIAVVTMCKRSRGNSGHSTNYQFKLRNRLRAIPHHATLVAARDQQYCFS